MTRQILRKFGNLSKKVTLLATGLDFLNDGNDISGFEEKKSEKRV
jgi:hypothetical protein